MIMKIKGKITGYGPIVIAVIAFLFILNYLLNTIAYFDAAGFCYISINADALKGNKNTINKAIIQLKKQDEKGYKTLCRYVAAIHEQNCGNFDSRVSANNGSHASPGCFIKGSKAIYVIPKEEDSDRVVTDRMETIKKYAQYSKLFWEGFGR